MLKKAMQEFLRLESAGGLVLLAAAVLAMVVVNSPLETYYAMLLSTPVEIRIGALEVAKPLLLWINDGLMAVFFFLVGMELKREIIEGELSDPRKVALPVLAAVGGMAVPALVYVALNRGDPVALGGWAIPAATDIAFALAVLTLLGSRVPNALKLFLLTLAIIDDLGAIVIIAVFYSGDLTPSMLGLAAAALAILFVMNRRGVSDIAPYLLVGMVLWLGVLKSGVHATLAGVLLAMFIPLKGHDDRAQSPLRRLEHDLHKSVAFGILPLFAFANAGIDFTGLTLSSLLQPVPLGIALGLFIGKQIGVVGFTWLGTRLGVGRLPEGVGWPEVYGMSILCGIGFTMSLFISSLAFGQATGLGVDDRLGIITGSLVSAVVGYLFLRWVLGRRNAPGPAMESGNA
jgi:NhaA family Na+:H+ antiporter